MGYAFVFLVAVAVGVAVYITTVRGSGAVAEGFAGAGDPSASADPGTYLSVTPARPDWRSRLTGFLGLVIAVVVGAIVLAFTLYIGVEWLVRLATDAVND